jgi:hypothetical protein
MTMMMIIIKILHNAVNDMMPCSLANHEVITIPYSFVPHGRVVCIALFDDVGKGHT